MSHSHTAPGIVEIHETPHPSRYRDLLHDAGRSRRCPVLFGFRAVESAGGMPLPDDPWAAVAAADPRPILPRPDRSQDPTTFAAAVAFARDIGPYSDLAVVEAARPADVPLAMRWSGARGRGAPDLVGLTAVLRSWEERFGALLVRLDGTTLVLTVAFPPTTGEEAETVAAEHLAFCPGRQEPRTSAETVRGVGTWRFRWD